MLEHLLRTWENYELDEYQGLTWIEASKKFVEEMDFEYIEHAPDKTIVAHRNAFMMGKGTYFTFKSPDEELVRHGFVYMKFEGGVSFVEVTEQ